MYDHNHPENIADQILIYAIVSHLIHGAASRKDALLCSYTIDETHPRVTDWTDKADSSAARQYVYRLAEQIVSRMQSVLGAAHVAVPYFLNPNDTDERPHASIVRDVLISGATAAFTYAQKARGEDAYGAHQRVTGLMETIRLCAEVEEHGGVRNSALGGTDPDKHYRMVLRFHVTEMPENVSR